MGLPIGVVASLLASPMSIPSPSTSITFSPDTGAKRSLGPLYLVGYSIRSSNKTPIDSYTNQLIGGRAPSEYLPILRKYMPESMPKERLERILKAHWIAPDELEEDDFTHCFVERGQAILDLITRTMGKSAVNGRQVFRDELKSASLGIVQDDDEEVDHDPIGEGAYGGTGALSGS